MLHRLTRAARTYATVSLQRNIHRHWKKCDALDSKRVDLIHVVAISAGHRQRGFPASAARAGLRDILALVCVKLHLKLVRVRLHARQHLVAVHDRYGRCQRVQSDPRCDRTNCA
jgi:hypothetical protein